MQVPAGHQLVWSGYWEAPNEYADADAVPVVWSLSWLDSNVICTNCLFLVAGGDSGYLAEKSLSQIRRCFDGRSSCLRVISRRQDIAWKHTSTLYPCIYAPQFSFCNREDTLCNVKLSNFCIKGLIQDYPLSHQEMKGSPDAHLLSNRQAIYRIIASRSINPVFILFWFLISDFWFMISSHHISSQLYSSREIWSDQLQAKLMIWLAPWHLPPTHRMMPFREGTGHLSNSSFIIPPLAPTNWSLPHINHVGWVTNVIAHWGFLPLRAMHVTGRITQVLRIGKKYRMRKYTLVLKVSRLESEQWSTFVACLNFMSIMPWSTTGSLELLFGDMHVWWA